MSHSLIHSPICVFRSLRICDSGTEYSAITRAPAFYIFISFLPVPALLSGTRLSTSLFHHRWRPCAVRESRTRKRDSSAGIDVMQSQSRMRHSPQLCASRLTARITFPCQPYASLCSMQHRDSTHCAAGLVSVFSKNHQ